MFVFLFCLFLCFLFFFFFFFFYNWREGPLWTRTELFSVFSLLIVTGSYRMILNHRALVNDAVSPKGIHLETDTIHVNDEILCAWDFSSLVVFCRPCASKRRSFSHLKRGWGEGGAVLFFYEHEALESTDSKLNPPIST